MARLETNPIVHVKRIFDVDEDVRVFKQADSKETQRILTKIEDRETSHFESILANLALTI